MKDRLLTLALFVLGMPAMVVGQAHFGPGVGNIRDYSVPEPGLYAVVYNYGYNTSTLTDNNGIKINQVFVGNIPAKLNLDVKLYALAPMVLWVSDWNFLGAHYSAYISPTFSNAKRCRFAFLS
jgi:hypothetical protein